MVNWKSTRLKIEARLADGRAGWSSSYFRVRTARSWGWALRWRVPVAVAVGLWWSPLARGAWGSIRANNHAAPVQRGGHEVSRPAPTPAPERGGHEVSRPAPAPAPEHGGEKPREQHAETIRPPEHGAEIERNRERGEAAARAAEAARVNREHWHEDIDADRRHGFFWFGFHPGMIITALPPDYSQVYVGGTPYYYDQGVYYQPGASGYVVVRPPIGAVVPVLPPGAETVVAGGAVYYYAAGAFYVQTPQGYAVVQPPLGVTVSSLPPDAVPVSINGMTYYMSGGAYYLPVMQAGVTVYMTVQP